MYFSKFAVITKTVLRDHNRLFEGQTFETLTSQKRWELAQNTSYDLFKIWYFPSNGVYENLKYSRNDLDLRFEDKNLKR